MKSPTGSSRSLICRRAQKARITILSLAAAPGPALARFADKRPESGISDYPLWTLPLFLVFLWLFVSENSPLHDWAEENTWLAVLITIFGPVAVGILVMP